MQVMGVAERKERHKEDMKNYILQAAKELFTERGIEATSIRNIAEKIEYSPATIYLHYKDKNDIIHALHQDGFLLLAKHFGVIQSVSDPFEQLKLMGKAYIKFALEHPDVYKLIFIMEEPLRHLAECVDKSWGEGDQAYGLLYKTVEACQQAGYFKRIDPTGLSFVIWSTMHGLCSLRISGHLGHMIESHKVPGIDDGNLDALVMDIHRTFVSVLERMKP
jgi:AcrR family transcriptional regulator